MFLQTIVDGIMLGGLYAIIGMGLAVVFGTMRIINFAHGQFVMVGMYISYACFQFLHIDPYLSIGISFVISFLLGILVFRLTLKPILHAPEMNHILLTAGLGLMLTNLSQMVFNTNQLTVNLPYGHHTIHFLHVEVNQAYLLSFIIAGFVALFLFLFMLKTETGRSIRAISQNSSSSALMGIPVNRITTLVFGLGIAIAGVAGTLLLPVHYVDPSVGDSFSLLAFIIVVLGGMGSIFGAGIGGILIGLIWSLSSFYLGGSYGDVLTYIMFLLVLLLKPSGLFGRSRV
ncbi:branched-chain amino acid ABC transporter permease [Fodinisporobacter ferrooxydans]|uniref:Branched-chain amino acid ABC transporter permease n=1 Tax=Fodinisporobacter ferrooxydans TaxID=2901836 RepID=A0ABY4CSB0_9BACL|nr:branched-chain amino acid ABC transporter permease [Alicyclobacillaceae bacterium MYW30-H2]